MFSSKPTFPLLPPFSGLIFEANYFCIISISRIRNKEFFPTLIYHLPLNITSHLNHSNDCILADLRAPYFNFFGQLFTYILLFQSIFPCNSHVSILFMWFQKLPLKRRILLKIVLLTFETLLKLTPFITAKIAS